MIRILIIALIHMVYPKWCKPLELLHTDGSVSRVCTLCGYWEKVR